MIKNIVFDIGRVLVHYDPIKFLKDQGYSDKMIEEIYPVIFDNDIWYAADRGIINHQEQIEKYCSLLPQYRNEIVYIMDNWPNMLAFYEDSLKVFKSCINSKYKVYLLSNFPCYGFEQMVKKFPILKEVDGMIISYQVKQLKPEYAIYENLLNKYNLKAEETIFIDDSFDNIKAANELNIKGILFKENEDLYAKLRSNGLKI